MNLDTPCTSAAGMLALSQFRGVGPKSRSRLGREFHTLREILDASPTQIRSACRGRLPRDLNDRPAWRQAISDTERLLETASRHSVRVLAPTDADYPAWLANIQEPPIIHVKGRLQSDPKHVACIGTRQPSRFGEVVTRRIARHLVESGWSIVSGLALGVDTLAHRAALEVEGHTVAILATGLDTVYPRRNTRLADAILDSGGALLSEHPVGTPLIPRNLVLRDRLQSGMSAGTIVMQTDLVGGSMHTVRFTLQQRRLLFAPVPTGTHARAPRSRGLLALTQSAGPELADRLSARGDYRTLLTTRYCSSPPAIPIHGKEDYERLLDRLNGKARETPGSTSARAPAGYAQGGLFANRRPNNGS